MMSNPEAGRRKVTKRKSKFVALDGDNLRDRVYRITCELPTSELQTILDEICAYGAVLKTEIEVYE